MTVKDWLEERCREAGYDDPCADTDLCRDVDAFVKKGGARSLKAGGAWIYDNEIDHIETGGRRFGADESGPVLFGGEIVRVKDFDGYVLGFGCVNPASKIRVRMLARYEKEGITPSFLRRRIRDAWEYRKAVMGGEDLSCCRVIFGEADFLPGITVDRFDDVLVIESLSLGTDRLKELILLDLVEILAEDGIGIRGIYERSDAKVRLLEGMERVRGFIGPAFDTMIPIVENGIRYTVDVKDGQKTGFFLDQKYNRRAVGDLVRNLAARKAAGKKVSGFTESPEDAAAKASCPEDGVSVLDCFTHTGSFGLNAAKAGAGHVLSVDASESAIAMARENAAANGLDDVTEYLVADVFTLLPRLEAEGRKYDMVILDPPAFTKSRQATKNAVKGYREINLRGMKLVKDGGFLATCSCSHFMEEELFKKTLAEAARGARKRLRQVEFCSQAPDHPVLWGDDASYYLKFGLFQVLEER